MKGEEIEVQIENAGRMVELYRRKAFSISKLKKLRLWKKEERHWREKLKSLK